jgi:hypothetical protein
VVQHLPKASIYRFLCSSNFWNLKCLFFIADLVYKAFMFNFSHIQINKIKIAIWNSILSIKNGNDNVRIEDNCLEEELATTPILSEIRTLSLWFVMLMRFFALLNIYYKTFLTRMQCDTTPFTSCCHNVDFCIAFLRQSANNYRHCSFCA